MMICWNVVMVSLDFSENSMESWMFIGFQCKFNEDLWILVGWQWAFHWKPMDAHRFSMGSKRFPLETRWWASCGPRGAPGGGEDFYLSRARRLYCLGLSSLLSWWPACDSHWISIKFHCESVPMEWKWTDFQWISMGFQWVWMDFNGFAMEFNGFEWIFNGFQWIVMDFR